MNKIPDLSYLIQSIVIICQAQDVFSIKENSALPVITSTYSTHNIIKNTVGINLTCHADGNPKPTVRWLDTNLQPVQNISGYITIDKDSTLQLLPITEPTNSNIHRSKYRCSATNEVGTVLSEEISVKFVSSDHYTRYGAEVSSRWTIPGNTAIFSCKIQPAYVKPYITVTDWLVNDQSVSDNIDSRITVVSGSRVEHSALLIKNIRNDDSGMTVACVTRNSFLPAERKTSQAKELILASSIFTKPSIEHKQEGIMMTALGDNLKLPCVSHANPFPRIVWYKNSILLPGHNSEVLTINHVTYDDSGIYKCHLTNSEGSANASFEVTVYGPLTVSLIPSEQIVDEASNASLKCVINGQPTLTITWYKDGQILSMGDDSNLIFESNNRVLTIPHMRRHDAAVYQCMVTNTLQSVISTTLLSRGDFSPDILSLNDTFITEIGQTVTLECRAFGNPIPQIEWFHTDYNAASETTADTREGPDGEVISTISLNIASVLAGGLYACVATNRRSTTDKSLEVRVVGKPTVFPIADRIVFNRQYTEIQCYTAGYPIDTIIWKKNGQLILNSSTTHIEPSGLITLRKMSESDSGNYSCTALTGVWSSTQAFQLKVAALPVVPALTIPDVITSGDAVIVFCQTQGGDEPFSYQWFKDTEAFNINSYPNLKIDTESSHSTLTFRPISKSDESNYTCSVSNKAGETNRSILVQNIRVAPSWLVEPVNSSLLLGRTVMLHCSTDGFPKSRVKWTYSTEAQFGYEAVCLKPECRTTLFENGTLKIDDTQANYEGFYACTAINDVSQISKQIFFDVLVPAELKIRTETILGTANSELQLDCVTRGDLPITTNWSQRYTSSDSWTPVTEHSRYVLQSQTKTIENELVELSTLTISKSTRGDNGEYLCTSSNQYGTSTRLITLIVRERPSAPSEIRTSSISSRSATVDWVNTDDGDSRILRHELLILENGDTTARSIQLNSTELHIAITNLTPAVSYSLMIRSVNVIGSSNYSEPIKFTTDEDIPGAPVDVAVKALNSYSIQVSWKTLTSRLNGKPLGYQISYTPKFSESQNVLLNLTFHPNTTFTLTRLRPATEYNIAVAVFNSRGVGVQSQPIQVKTYCLVAPAAPAGVSVTTGHDTMTVSYSRVNMGRVDANLTNYIVYIQSVRDSSSESLREIETSDLRLTVGGLRPHTNYSVTVAGITEYGSGVSSEPLYVLTEPAVSAAPMIKAGTVNSTTVLFSWLAELPLTGEPEEILVKQTAGREILKPFIVRGSEGHIFFRGLPTRTDYTFEARLKYRGFSLGQKSSPVTATTTNSVPPSIALHRSNITVSSRVSYVILDCVVGGSVVSWSRLDGALPRGANKQSNNSLKIFNPKPGDSGSYKCLASNSRGRDSFVYRLTVKDVYSTPVLKTSVVSNRAQISWFNNQPDHYPQTAVLMYKSPNSEWISNTVSSISYKLNTYWLELEYGVQYEIKLIITDTSYSLTNIQTHSLDETVVDFYGLMVDEESGVCLNTSIWINQKTHLTQFRLRYRDNNYESIQEVGGATMIVCSKKPYTNLSLLELEAILDGRTVAKLTGGKAGDVRSTITSPRTPILAIALSVTVVIIITLALLVFGVVKYKKNKKIRQTVGTRQSKFSSRKSDKIKREGLSADSGIWLLNGSTDQRNDIEGDYEICTPTLTFSGSKHSEVTATCCQEGLCQHDLTDKLLMQKNNSAAYSDDEQSPPSPVELLLYKSAPHKTLRFTPHPDHRITPRSFTYHQFRCASCQGSVATEVSSTHDELLYAYHNSKLIQFMEPPRILPSQSDSSANYSHGSSGIQQFSASPPQPLETRQAVCQIQVPPSHNTTNTADTLPVQGSYNCQTGTISSDLNSSTIDNKSNDEPIYQTVELQSTNTPSCQKCADTIRSHNYAQYRVGMSDSSDGFTSPYTLV